MTAGAPSAWRFYAGLGLRLLALVAVILAASEISGWVKNALGFDLLPTTGTLMPQVILLALLCYILLTAIPFVPGAEIGLAMLTVFGAPVAPLIYGATVLSLSLAFTIGRLVPPDRTTRLLRRLHLPRAAALLERIAQAAPQDRAATLLAQLDAPATAWLARHRYVALLILVNLPGNVVIGGGGGLSLAAGLSGVFSPLRFVATIALAVLPVPLTIYLLGS